MSNKQEVIQELETFLTKLKNKQRSAEIVHEYSHSAFVFGEADTALEAFTIGLISYFSKLETGE